MEKLCSVCNQPKDISQFGKAHKNKDGYDVKCKSCRNEFNRLYRESNKDAYLAARKRNYIKNIDKMRFEKVKYYHNHVEAKAAYDRVYRVENKQKIRGYKKSWEIKNKTRVDIRIKRNLYRRINHVIMDGYKSAHTLDLLGCTFDEFLIHLESQFTENMSWDNYGQYGWHVDHVKPCNAFDLTDPTQQRECFNYKNLQPLWWVDNLKKSKKWK